MVMTYRSLKTIIKASAKGGKGLFASENILADEIIAIRAGHIVNTEKAVKLDKELGDFSLQITDEFYICPESKEEIKDLAIFINHSCDPNIGMDGK
jgi:SET domain-containing protein